MIGFHPIKLSISTRRSIHREAAEVDDDEHFLFTAFPPPVPLITSAEFIAPALIGLKWEVCPPVPMIDELEGDEGANSNIIAFSINYAQELCLPEILTINRVCMYVS